jgi:hypothetical protein
LETADPREEPEDRICGGGAAFEIKSKRADPHRRRNDEKADHDQRKNILNDTGHNSLLSLYVHIMFYFCSSVKSLCRVWATGAATALQMPVVGG